MLSWAEIQESFNFSARALVVNKLRTFLSLLGVTIGIFAIIGVFALIDSMEANIKGMISDMGDDLVMVGKWPITIEEGESEYPWWKYLQRPEPSVRDKDMLLDRLTNAQGVAFRTDVRRELSAGNSLMENGTVLLCSQSMEKVYPMKLESGRYFTDAEERMAKPVCLLGYDVSETLFGSLSPLGKTMKIAGRKVTVIGKFEREGESIAGDNIDDIAMVPVTFGRQFADIRETENTLLVRAKAGVSLLALKDEITGVLRGIHRLRPKEEKDFSINQMSMITNILDEIFSFFTIVALVIGSFSILVGGFGIANIMFVSVKERTGIIGIQKALGAKEAFILLHFLIESVFLSFIGGALALLLIYALALIGTHFAGFEIFLSTKNVVTGLSVSLVIGVVAGVLPAWRASRLSPVDAIRAN